MNTSMRQRLSNSDRGAGLVEYALIVLVVALASLAGLQSVGTGTSESFGAVGDGFDDVGLDEDAGLTPEEKWEKAKQDYRDAIAEAKAKRSDDLADAKAEYQAAKAENKNLPKNERKAANQQAKADYKAAKSAANQEYKSSVNEAKSARDAAKAEYKATK